MGERPDQIEMEIQQERRELGRNLRELEDKVKSATDWRSQFDRHPMPMMAIVFGSGLLLSAAIGSRNARQSSRSAEGPTVATNTSSVDHQNQRTRGTWDNIKGALIGVTTDRVRGFLDEFIPGFAEHYRRNEVARDSGEMPVTPQQHSEA
jgi:hypothetical protein